MLYILALACHLLVFKSVFYAPKPKSESQRDKPVAIESALSLIAHCEAQYVPSRYAHTGHKCKFRTWSALRHRVSKCIENNLCVAIRYVHSCNLTDANTPESSNKSP